MSARRARWRWSHQTIPLSGACPRRPLSTSSATAPPTASRAPATHADQHDRRPARRQRLHRHRQQQQRTSRRAPAPPTPRSRPSARRRRQPGWRRQPASVAAGGQLRSDGRGRRRDSSRPHRPLRDRRTSTASAAPPGSRSSTMARHGDVTAGRPHLPASTPRGPRHAVRPASSPHDHRRQLRTGPARRATVARRSAVVRPIHDIQGPGAVSPLAGQVVTTHRHRHRRARPTASSSRHPTPSTRTRLTSEGIFVFTERDPPAAAAIGNLVRVRGTVTEFVPAPTRRARRSPSSAAADGASLLSAGNPLPAPVDARRRRHQSDRHDRPARAPRGHARRRGRAARRRAHRAASSTSPPRSRSRNGVFYGVHHRHARPFREPGIDVARPVAARRAVLRAAIRRQPGAAARGQRRPAGRAALEVDAGALRHRPGRRRSTTRSAPTRILPDPGKPRSVGSGGAATPVRLPAADEFTVAVVQHRAVLRHRRTTPASTTPC